MKVTLRLIISILLFCILLPAVSALSQYSYINLTTFNYEDAPFRISDPLVRAIDSEGYRLYVDLQNVSTSKIIGMQVWFMLYFEGKNDPVIKEYTISSPIEPGELRNFYWDEMETDAGKPVTGVFAPIIVELSDGTYWSLRNYYALESLTETGDEEKLEYPLIGNVTFSTDSIGIINAGKINGLVNGQRAGIVRKSDDGEERVAQIKILKSYATRSGYSVKHMYPGMKIEPRDKVQVVLPGMSRLHATTKSILLMSGVSGAAGGIFRYIRNNAEDDLRATMNPVIAEDHRNKFNRYNLRYNAALWNTGMLLGGTLLSEVIWGRDGKHLYPVETGSMNVRNWNTTTRTFMTIGAVSLGGALYNQYKRNYAEDRMSTVIGLGRHNYYRDQKQISRYRRDASVILAGTAIGTGLLHQYLWDNEWPFYQNGSDRSSLSNWNPVSKGFMLMGANAVGTSLVFQYLKQKAASNSVNSFNETDRSKYDSDAVKYRNWRDISYIIGGSALISGFIHEFLFRPQPDDIFDTECYLSAPRMSGPASVFAVVTATLGGTALYYHSRVGEAKSKHEDTVFNGDPIGQAHYLGKIDDYESYRTYSIVSAGVSFAATLFSHLMTKDKKMSALRRITSPEHQSPSSTSITPEIDILRNTIGVSIRF
ncbi:hypothetical protein ACFL67_00215 [candidate division KSB1 bacterium]